MRLSHGKAGDGRARMTHGLKRIVGFSLLVYLGFGAFLYAFQRSLIYHPMPPVPANAEEQITVRSGGERLRVWQVNPGREAALVYFGGNAEVVSGNAETFRRLFPERSSYLVNYRGYGGSTGEPSEQGLYRDALAVFDRIRAAHSDVAVVGRSLGTGVATYLAAHRPVERLVLVTPYDSVQSVAQARYPLYPMSVLLKDKFDSLSRADAIRVPTLVLTAERDRLITSEHSRRLVAAIDPRWVEQIVVEDADHFDIDRRAAYRASLVDFLNPGPD
jgi:pimeloyl-ACP methyl ester carboxylesterase